MPYYPRLLLIDMTPIQGVAATSALKRAYFEDWPDQRLIHIRSGGRGLVEISAGADLVSSVYKDAFPVKALLDAFTPDLILYRPVADHPVLHKWAMEVIAKSEAPLVTWLMDDWPERLRAEDPDAAAAMSTDLQKLFDRASINFAISEGMAIAFSERYNVDFEVAHNGVASDEWDLLRRDALDRSGLGGSVLVRYAGSLAPDTTSESVLEVARAVSDLSLQGVGVCFEGYTQAHWFEQNMVDFNALPGVTLRTSDLSDEDYRAWLCAADIVLMAYNFDEDTKRYLQFSFANKLPELLSCGAALLAYGPETLETLAYLERNKIGRRVLERDAKILHTVLNDLVANSPRRVKIGQEACQHASEFFSLSRVRGDFMRQIHNLVPSPDQQAVKVYERSEKICLDECGIIFDLLGKNKKPGIMIDVGAHVGGSLMPFARADWCVIALEPDEKNRAVLQSATSSLENVEVLPQAAGQAVQKNVKFYTSNISSGISSLSAFHSSHKHAAQVDITTLDEIITSRSLSHIDFLKIDVEGYEADVLKGLDLDQCKPAVIMLEFEDSKAVFEDGDLASLAEYLQNHCYHVFVSEWHAVVEYGRKHDWRQFSQYPLSVEKGSWGNLLAFREKPDELELHNAVANNLHGTQDRKNAAVVVNELRPVLPFAKRVAKTIFIKFPRLHVVWLRFKAAALAKGGA